MDVKPDQPAIASEAGSTPLPDLPLIDFCDTPEANVALASESRPLIDLLINTPDLSREAPSKPLPDVGQVRSKGGPELASAPGGLGSGRAPHPEAHHSDLGEWSRRLARWCV